MTNLTEHKQRLLHYFDGLGFERWSAIYGDARVSGIRQTIREGHALMVQQAEAWVLASGDQPQVLDAGCGTGLLSVALARHGLQVTAVDLAPQMVSATTQAAQAAGVSAQICCYTSDLEAVQGLFDTVVCLDVLVHYPQPGFSSLLGQLARLSRGRVLFTYAPREPLLAALHWFGGRFPTNHRRTEIAMIAPREMEQALSRAGLRLRRSQRISQGFYHVTLVEAERR